MKKMKWILGLFLILALLAAAATAMAAGEQQYVEPSEKEASELVYKGSEIALINPGTTTLEGAKWQYTTIDNPAPEQWSDSVPTATDVMSSAVTVYYQLLVPGESQILCSGSISNVNLVPAPLSISWSEDSLTYNGSAQAPTPIISGQKNGESITAHVEVSDKKIDAGINYSAAAVLDFGTGVERTNYTDPSDLETTFSIGQKELTASVAWADGATVTYDAQPHGITVNLTGAIPGETPVYTDTIGGADTQTNAGEYAVAVSLTDADVNKNYTIKNVTPEKLSIGKASLSNATITLATSSFDYDKSAKTPAINSVTVGTIPVSSNEYGDPSYTNNTNANATGTTPTVTITAVENGNFTGSKSVGFTINQKEAELSWTDLNPEYDAQPHKPTVTVTNLCGTGSDQDTCEVTVSGEQTAAGTNYEAEATALSNQNYKLPTDTKNTFSISQATVGLDWSHLNDLIYNGTAQYPTATATGLQGSDTCNVTVTKPDSAQDPIHQGIYTAVASELSNPNYKLPAATACIASYMINKLTATLNWTDTEFTYDGDPHQPTATVSNLQTIGTTQDVCNVTLSDSSTQTEANEAGQTYGAEAISLSNTDYQLPSNPTTRFTINPEPVSDTNRITVSGLETSYQYTSNAIEPLPIVEDSKTSKVLVKDTDYEVAFSGNHTAVADSPVTVTITGKGNYTGTVEKQFTITAAPVTLAWTNNTPYTYNAQQQNPTAEVEGLLGKDTCDPEYAKVVSITVGDDYTYEVTGVKNPNYVLAGSAITTQDYKIIPKIAGLTWDYEEPYVYNGQEQCPGATVNNLCPGDECSVTVEPDPDADDPIHVGSYTAIATALSNENYELPADKSIPFEIVAKTATLQWSDTEFVYDTKPHLPKAEVTNLIGDDKCEVTVVKEETNQGTYTAEAVELKNDYDDYALPEVTTQEWTILRKPVKAITATVNGPTEDGQRLGGPDASKYHTITIDAEANEKMTVTIFRDGAVVTALKDFTAGDITIEKDAINGATLDGSGDVTYTVYAEYDDKDNLTTDEKSSRDSKPAPGVEDKFNYDTVAKAITVHPLYNRAAKGVGVTLPEGYRLVKFTSSGAGTDFVATNAASLAAGDHVIPFDVGENPKLNSTAKGGTFTGLYEDYVGNPGKVEKQDILKAKGTIEIISVEPPINDSGRIGNTPNLIFTVKMGADGGYSELANGGVFGTRTLSQGEQQITVAASSLVADGTNTPSLSFDDLEGSATFRSFIFDPVCDEPVLTFEPYAGCYYLMGLAEPYSQIVIEVNGEKVTGSADAFGVFALKMPLTEEGDIISIRVTDLAGNVTTTSYRVGPEIEDATMTAFMAGRVYTNAHGMKGGQPDWTMILTASVDDLKAGNVNVPIIAGNMVSIGTMSVKMDGNNNLSYSYTLEDGVQVLNEKFIANTKLEKDAFIAGLGIEVSPNGTLISDIQKGKVYLSCKMNVKVPAEMLKTTFQTEKIKDSDLKKRYRDIQNGKLN